MDAVSPQIGGSGGNTTLYIVIFFSCIVCVLSGVFSFRAQAARAEFERERIKAEFDEKARITEIEQERVKAQDEIEQERAEFEQERAEAQADEKARTTELEQERVKAQADEKARTSEISAKLSVREELLKKLEERVTADLSAAAKTVKDANELKRNAVKASNDAAWHLGEAEKAQERADATGKENDKRLAEEKKKMADEATKKVEKAQKEADDAIEKASEEAKKAKELKEKLDKANAKIDKLATSDESVTFAIPAENEDETQSPLQKEANKAVARLEELMAGGPPDARNPPTEEEITDARNEAKNAVLANMAVGGYNPYDAIKAKKGMKKQLSGQTVQEIQLVSKNGGVSQGIQQVGGESTQPPSEEGRSFHTQGIQQVGGGVSQGIQEIPMKDRRVSQGIQQVGGGVSPLQKEANKAVARLEELMAGGGNATSKAERIEEITDARNEAKNAVLANMAAGGYNPYDAIKAKKGMKKQLSGQTVQDIQLVSKRGGVSQGIQQIGGMGLCFSGSTKVNMVSGETMCIKDISLGDELAGGTLVDATLQIKNRSNDPFYRFNSTELGDCVYVTGSHYIHHDDKYIFVRDHPEAVLTDKCDDILYCLVTSDHTIPVGEFKFWDWEDNLIRN